MKEIIWKVFKIIFVTVFLLWLSIVVIVLSDVKIATSRINAVLIQATQTLSKQNILTDQDIEKYNSQLLTITNRSSSYVSCSILNQYQGNSKDLIHAQIISSTDLPQSGEMVFLEVQMITKQNLLSVLSWSSDNGFYLRGCDTNADVTDGALNPSTPKVSGHSFMLYCDTLCMKGLKE